MYCPVCGAVMDNMGPWPTYPDNYNRLYYATFVCSRHDPASTKTMLLGVLYRPDDHQKALSHA